MTLACNTHQPLPAASSENQKFVKGAYANPLNSTHSRSILQHLITLGVPVSVLSEQLCMVVGLMDISSHLFYQDWDLTYAQRRTERPELPSSRISLGGRGCSSSARQIESCWQAAGTVRPVSIHVPESKMIYIEISHLRCNPIMLNVFEKATEDIINAAGIGDGDVAILTPYREQLKALYNVYGLRILVYRRR